jgi:predicted secreted Zn-dependent protease
LFKHEQQHKDYGVQAANELEQALLAINERQACSTLQNNMADTAQQILDKYDQLEKEFDRVTNHGLNQGIKLQ